MDSQNLKGTIRCVIYDCDGVLFDSFEANTRLYNDFCLHLGREPLRPEEMEYVHAHTVYEAIHFLFGRDKDLEKKALEFMKQLDLRKYIIYLKMEPDLLETLRRLKAAGVIRSICTNRTTSMKYIMEGFNLWPHFDMVVTALDVKHPKPHPESIEKIASSFQLQRNEILFVGDSEVDQQSARAAQVLFVAYKNRNLTGDFYIENHLELLRFL